MTFNGEVEIGDRETEFPDGEGCLTSFADRKTFLLVIWKMEKYVGLK